MLKNSEKTQTGDSRKRMNKTKKKRKEKIAKLNKKNISYKMSVLESNSKSDKQNFQIKTDLRGKNE